MYSLFLECPEQDAELLSSELWEEGASGIQEEPLPGARCQLRAWFDDPTGLLQRFATFRPRLEADPEVDWERASRQAWQPFAVGERLYLAPEWDEDPTPLGRMRLTIHPGLALGTGDHPATKLCLEALEKHLPVSASVLDVGAGTGILMAGAALLGARHVAGCDIEYDSIEVAYRNLLMDGLPPHVFAGSTRAVKSRSVDLVVANINALTHETLAAEYARVSRRWLILSGFPDRHAARVRAALREHGFGVVETIEKNEWVCLVLCNDDNS